MTITPVPETHTFCLTIEYDGTGFSGWQIQPDQRTVQGTIQEKLHLILQQRVKLAAAGRTDTGVHALGQVASFHVETKHNANTIQRALNALLPEDVAIREVLEVYFAFHACFDALSRHYRYRISLRRNPLERSRVWYVPYHLDLQKMSISTAVLVGTHDFRSFCSNDSHPKSYMCKVCFCRWVEQDDEIWLEIEADRFLHNMVRTIVATAVDVGRGKRHSEHIWDILKARDRTKAGKAAPPQGLYLVDVRYPL